MPNKQLPVSSRPEFTRLPSDPRIALTPAQAAALWGGDVDGMLVEITALMLRDADFLRRVDQPSHAAPASATVPIGDEHAPKSA